MVSIHPAIWLYAILSTVTVSVKCPSMTVEHCMYYYVLPIQWFPSLPYPFSSLLSQLTFRETSRPCRHGIWRVLSVN